MLFIGRRVKNKTTTETFTFNSFFNFKIYSENENIILILKFPLSLMQKHMIKIRILKCVYEYIDAHCFNLN